MTKYTFHGHATGGKLSRIYVAWAAMKQRVQDPNREQAKDYSGRGITICDHWRDSFTDFESDIRTSIGPHPGRGFTLDRKNNNGNYEPGNVRWATYEQQSRNRRKRAGTASKYQGVSPHSGKFISRIKGKDGICYYLGRFADEQVAALTYDIASLKHNGSEAFLNFPELLPKLQQYIDCETALAELDKPYLACA